MDPYPLRAEGPSEILRSVAMLAVAASHEINNPLMALIASLELLEAHGFQPVGMGSRTLRTDTACIALLALFHDALMSCAGDKPLEPPIHRGL